MTTDQLITASNDYSSYCDIKLDNKLKPIYDFIEQLLVRFEEFQVLLDVTKLNKTFPASMVSCLSFKNDFESLCDKVDRLEVLMFHIQSNLDDLEEDIIKKETELGFGESSIKVPSILTPLFKKVDKKEKPATYVGPFKSKEYFTTEITKSS